MCHQQTIHTGKPTLPEYNTTRYLWYIIGFLLNQAGYQVYIPSSGHILVSLDVPFDESFTSPLAYPSFGLVVAINWSSAKMTNQFLVLDVSVHSNPCGVSSKSLLSIFCSCAGPDNPSTFEQHSVLILTLIVMPCYYHLFYSLLVLYF